MFGRDSGGMEGSFLMGALYRKGAIYMKKVSKVSVRTSRWERVALTVVIVCVCPGKLKSGNTFRNVSLQTPPSRYSIRSVLRFCLIHKIDLLKVSMGMFMVVRSEYMLAQKPQEFKMARDSKPAPEWLWDPT